MNQLLTLNHPVALLLISSFLGAFLGIRREIKAQASRKHKSFMGLRTMVLLAFMGTISTFLPNIPYLPLYFFGSILVLVALAYAYGSFEMDRNGITTELSALMTFWIGVLVGGEEQVLAIIITIFLASINAFKEHLYAFIKTLTEKEWFGTLQLLVLSGAILPFLPREPIDTWGVFVPFNVWLLVILISGIGFMGYFFVKYFGAKGGIPLMAFLGAIVSSTAVTTSLSVQSKKYKLTGIFAVGILIGMGTMQLRVLAEIVLFGTSIFWTWNLLIPLAMSFASSIAAFYFFHKTNQKHRSLFHINPEVKITQPFELGPALKFGFIFVIVLFAQAAGKKYFGDSGVYAASVFSGLIDIDAIVLSSLESVKLGELSAQVAQNAITIALFVNTLIKILYVAIFGARKLVWKIATGVIFSSLVGGVMFLILW